MNYFKLTQMLLGAGTALLILSCGSDPEASRDRDARRTLTLDSIVYGGHLETDLRGIGTSGGFSPTANCVQQVKYDFSDGSASEDRLEISTRPCTSGVVSDRSTLIVSLVLDPAAAVGGYTPAYDRQLKGLANGVFAFLGPDSLSGYVSIYALCGLGASTHASRTAGCGVAVDDLGAIATIRAR